jgi:hypothetical protein
LKANKKKERNFSPLLLLPLFLDQKIVIGFIFNARLVFSSFFVREKKSFHYRPFLKLEKNFYEFERVEKVKKETLN